MIGIHRRKRGQGMVEVSVVVALVAIAAILILTVMGNGIISVYSNVTCSFQLTNCVVGSPGPSVSPTVSPSTSPSPTVSPASGRFAYVLNQGPSLAGPGSITKIDTGTLHPVGTLSVGIHPVAMSITPDASQIFVLNAGDDAGVGNDGSSKVSVISTSSFSVTANVAVSYTQSLVTKDASVEKIFSTATTTYVTSAVGGLTTGQGWSIITIDNATYSIGNISWDDLPCWWGTPCPEDLTSMVFTNGGDTAYVGDMKEHDITQITGLTGTPTVNTAFETATSGQIGPLRLASDGTTGYALNTSSSGRFSTFNLTSGAVTTGAFVGSVSQFSPGGEMMITATRYYASTGGANSVLETGTLPSGAASTISVGALPAGMDIDTLATPNPLLWVANYTDGTVNVVDTTTNLVVGSAIGVVDVNPIEVLIGAGRVESPPPALSASASDGNTSGTVPLDTTFTGSGSGGVPPYTYDWSFGDGGHASTASGTHTYLAAGTFAVSLTVTDAWGQTATATATTATVSANLAYAGGPAPTALHRYAYVLSVTPLTTSNGDHLDAVTRIDISTNAVFGSPLLVGKGIPSAGSLPLSVSPDGSKVFVLNTGKSSTSDDPSDGSTSVSVIDTSTFTVVATVHIPDFNPGHANFSGGLTTNDGEASSIASSDTYTYVTSYYPTGNCGGILPCPSNGWTIMAINNSTFATSFSTLTHTNSFTSGGGNTMSTLVLDSTGTTGYIYDKNFNEIDKLTGLPTPSVAAHVTAPSGAYTIRINGSEGFISFLSGGGDTFSLSPLAVSGSYAITGSNLYDLAVNSTDVFSDNRVDTVLAAPVGGGATLSNVVGSQPVYLAADAVTGSIWAVGWGVSNPANGFVYVLNGSTGATTATISSGMPTTPEGIAICSAC